MIKLMPPDLSGFHSFKCGEVYCETPASYSVSCCLCGEKLALGEFPSHFQKEHLSQKHPCSEPTQKHDDQDETKIGDIPQSILETEIKYESDEEKPAAAPFLVEDEKPIDITKVQYGGRSRASKGIIVQNFSIESCGSDDTRCRDSPQKEFEDIRTNADKLIRNSRCEDKAEDEDAITDAAFKDNCSANSTDNSDIEAKKQSETKPYNCKDCNSTYKSKQGLYNHIRSKHKKESKPRLKPQKFKCTECGQIFSSERNLSGHMLKHTGIICDICGKSFSQVGNMRTHRIRHTGIKAHKCVECDNSFYTDKELKAHMMRHTGILPIICEVCGRRCRDHGVLTAHMRRHTGERPAKCSVCGKSFYSVYDLNVHSVTHSNLRPFKCDICGSTFQTKKALRVHKKLHSTERKHKCNVCSKSFVQSSGLFSHMKTHNAADDKEEFHIVDECNLMLNS